jgi:hypothetical protein
MTQAGKEGEHDEYNVQMLQLVLKNDIKNAYHKYLQFGYISVTLFKYKIIFYICHTTHTCVP